MDEGFLQFLKHRMRRLRLFNKNGGQGSQQFFDRGVEFRSCSTSQAGNSWTHALATREETVERILFWAAFHVMRLPKQEGVWVAINVNTLACRILVRRRRNWWFRL